jgi:hypothetical protein
MSILGKLKVQKERDELTIQDLKFLLIKLRSATYTGEEFEQFYQVWVKLTDALEQKIKQKGT